MRGFIDLHCHWIAGIDDGARTTADSVALLQGLYKAGFSEVVATPHMRPGMFDNTKDDLEHAYAATRAAIDAQPGLPKLALSSEHFFDEIVFGRFLEGQVLPYPGGHAALVEFGTTRFPAAVAARFFDLRAKRRIRPVLAHPERYEPVQKDKTVLEPLLDGGAVLLLDVAALSGKYGRSARRSAEEMLDEGYYYAACSDAHAPRDVAEVAQGIESLFRLAGDEEANFLLIEGPRQILEGRVET